MDQATASIAIIGISCRFPAGAHTPDLFWELLVQGRNVWSDVPADRFDWRKFYHPDPAFDGTLNHRGGHFLTQNIAAFDAPFFNITPQEAVAMDPQQRLQLETAYEAFENAGISLERLRSSNTGVFVATFNHDYDAILQKDVYDLPKYSATGTGQAIISNRISYSFDLHGPSMTIDTGCSGSLVALHQACRSLQSGETDMCIVGGINLILNPDVMISMSNFQ